MNAFSWKHLSDSLIEYTIIPSILLSVLINLIVALFKIFILHNGSTVQRFFNMAPIIEHNDLYETKVVFYAWWKYTNMRQTWDFRSNGIITFLWFYTMYDSRLTEVDSHNLKITPVINELVKQVKKGNTNARRDIFIMKADFTSRFW